MNIFFISNKEFEIVKNDFSISEENGELVKGDKMITKVMLGSVSFPPDKIVDFLKSLEKQCTENQKNPIPKDVYIYDKSTCDDFCYAII